MKSSLPESDMHDPVPTGTHRGMIQTYTASADLLVVRARWGDAARGCGWSEGGRLLASWPFGSFGPSQKNKEI
ncbi:hypothetical protein J2X69_001294 [Algoriphagus sp. 4150]|uniref:hypothetical protein n=1 Tax=Algoriphagus sp. 4150 TaxID=2817756 RepID=UPI00285EEAFF|nr:hypothetical protein [Algoriphagus sp. 4150]MDR7128959.1 hypothetical protein [Algoriphagus sp. 4150]